MGGGGGGGGLNESEFPLKMGVSSVKLFAVTLIVFLLFCGDQASSARLSYGDRGLSLLPCYGVKSEKDVPGTKRSYCRGVSGKKEVRILRASELTPPTPISNQQPPPEDLP
ncbi:hypothetical protein GIB67_042682 [Kingdonia uniflora]|uniref:Uncharacterized protein n=1 Tax=Kingdonia uniflora TaxID=39325 RepID=A0A7J7P2T2_9MAGN|nr:hypothetical protein GIB67_042682 [Kingdonia uniflora]